MKGKKIIILLSVIFFLNIINIKSDPAEFTYNLPLQAAGLPVDAQEIKEIKRDINSDEKTGYRVMLIALVIWFALSIYIYKLHKKVRHLETRLDESEKNNHNNNSNN